MLSARSTWRTASKQQQHLATAAPVPAFVRLQRTYASSSSSSSLADQQASSLTDKGWKGTCANGEDTKLFIGGEWRKSEAKEWMEVRDPVSLVPPPPPFFFGWHARASDRERGPLGVKG